jgi:hypothetical protein
VHLGARHIGVLGQPVAAEDGGADGAALVQPYLFEERGLERLRLPALDLPPRTRRCRRPDRRCRRAAGPRASAMWPPGGPVAIIARAAPSPTSRPSGASARGSA